MDPIETYDKSHDKPCQRCGSARVLLASSHGRDMHSFSIAGFQTHGYVLRDLALGDSGGDDLVLEICLECGQVQGGNFPHPSLALEHGEKAPR